jgi:hypothetical protein
VGRFERAFHGADCSAEGRRWSAVEGHPSDEDNLSPDRAGPADRVAHPKLDKGGTMRKVQMLLHDWGFPIGLLMAWAVATAYTASAFAGVRPL